MSTYLIATLAVLVLVFFVLGYLWLVPRKRSANFLAYQEISRAAERIPRQKSLHRSAPDWR